MLSQVGCPESILRLGLHRWEGRESFVYRRAQPCNGMSMVFGIRQFCGCESWALKKAEHWRIDAFELWCWRRLLRVPWTARRSNQSILKEISPGCSLEGLMLRLKLQSFGYLMQRCWERLKVGGEGNNRGRDGWIVSPTQWIWTWASYGRWWWTGKPGVLQSVGSQSRTPWRDWTTTVELVSDTCFLPRGWVTLRKLIINYPKPWFPYLLDKVINALRHFSEN